MSGTTVAANEKGYRAKKSHESLVSDVLRLWPTDLTIRELGQKLRVSQERIYVIATEHGLTGKVYEPTDEVRKKKARDNAKARLRASGSGGKFITKADDEPTPEEIKEYEQRRDEIRRGWSEEEEYARFAGPKSQNYACRTYGFSHTNYVAYEMPADA
jgi:hypothetical protein